MNVRRLQHDDYERFQKLKISPTCCFLEYSREANQMQACGSEAVAIAGAIQVKKPEENKFLCAFHANYSCSNDKKLKKDWHGEL